jgi:ankyrin repeat protein
MLIGTRTPLHVAVQQGNDFECARLLLENGADAFQQDTEGRSALHYFYNEVVRQLLLYYADDIDPWMQDRSGMTVLHWASWSRSSSRQALTCFPHKGGESSCYGVKDVHGKSMLHYAVQRGNADLIAFFLASPDAATMSMSDFSGKTILHCATESGRPDTINTMLEVGIDLDVVDNQGRSVLHHAAMRGNLLAAQRLVELGASYQLSRKDKNGQTPADLACRYSSELVQDYFESLGHQGHVSEKRAACLPFETNVRGYGTASASWKIAIFVLVVFGMMYWNKVARARCGTDVTELRT